MKILAIDFGLSRFGLAVSTGQLIEPLLSLKNNQATIKKLGDLCRSNQIEKIILGLPEGRIKNSVLDFGKKLQQSSALPVSYEPEDFSTKEAREKMIEIGKPRRKRKTDEHQISACLILQSYLENRVVY